MLFYFSSIGFDSFDYQFTFTEFISIGSIPYSTVCLYLNQLHSKKFSHHLLIPSFSHRLVLPYWFLIFLIVFRFLLGWIIIPVQAYLFFFFLFLFVLNSWVDVTTEESKIATDTIVTVVRNETQSQFNTSIGLENAWAGSFPSNHGTAGGVFFSEHKPRAARGCLRIHESDTMWSD